jgi:hypothetical protein
LDYQVPLFELSQRKAGSLKMKSANSTIRSFRLLSVKVSHPFLLTAVFLALTLFLTSCDDSLRVSKDQVLTLNRAVVETRARKEKLMGDLNMHEVQNRDLPDRQMVLLSYLIDAVKQVEKTRTEFTNQTKNPKLLLASNDFFADVSNSLLSYEPQVRSMTMDAYAETKEGVFKLTDNNIAALRFVAESGTVEYEIVVSSVPAGAKVSYGKPGADLKPWSGSTNTRITGIGRADWNVRVETSTGKSEKQECSHATPICCLSFDLSK